MKCEVYLLDLLTLKVEHVVRVSARKWLKSIEKNYNLIRKKIFCEIEVAKLRKTKLKLISNIDCSKR